MTAKSKTTTNFWMEGDRMKIPTEYLIGVTKSIEDVISYSALPWELKEFPVLVDQSVKTEEMWDMSTKKEYGTEVCLSVGDTFPLGGAIQWLIPIPVQLFYSKIPIKRAERWTIIVYTMLIGKQGRPIVW